MQKNFIQNASKHLFIDLHSSDFGQCGVKRENEWQMNRDFSSTTATRGPGKKMAEDEHLSIIHFFLHKNNLR